MNNAPVSISTLLIPLNSATARKARRQAASAAPSSEAAKFCPGGRGSCVIVECLAPNRVYHDPAYQWLSIGGIIIAWFTPNSIHAGRELPGCRLQMKPDRKPNQTKRLFPALDLAAS